MMVNKNKFSYIPGYGFMLITYILNMYWGNNYICLQSLGATNMLEHVLMQLVTSLLSFLVNRICSIFTLLVKLHLSIMWTCRVRCYLGGIVSCLKFHRNRLLQLRPGRLHGTLPFSCRYTKAPVIPLTCHLVSYYGRSF